jgi:VacB/RNase II family 3'-5' exoribonuclease
MISLEDIARQAMSAHGFLPEFSPAAVQQLQSISAPGSAAGPDIADLRNLLWASIDNDDSRDLDQLSVSQTLPGGLVKVYVAIADVDAIVKAGSPIDAHASNNTTSVYTAAKIFPMLPEKLSTDLTSLGEAQERLAIVIEMTVTADGVVNDSSIYRAVVLNHAKLAYNGVGPWLAGTAPPPARVMAVPGMDQQLRTQDQVAQALKRVRNAKGALTLETIETTAVMQNGVLSDLRPNQKNRASELIEDFMIAANQVSARFLAGRGLASLRRVLRAPERWDRIVALAAALGERLPATPDAPALNAFLLKRRASDAAGFADLSLSVIKLLGRGEYALDPPGGETAGHFGLAVSDYTHSTAPNRRFPDLITQRLLKAALVRGASPYGQADLVTLAAHCTQQEDQAAKVERQVGKSAAAMLLAGRIGQSFDAIVTGASEKGTWVRISAPTTEGKVVQGGAGYDVGDRVRVKLIHTDVARGFIDFAGVH